MLPIITETEETNKSRKHNTLNNKNKRRCSLILHPSPRNYDINDPRIKRRSSYDFSNSNFFNSSLNKECEVANSGNNNNNNNINSSILSNSNSFNKFNNHFNSLSINEEENEGDKQGKDKEDEDFEFINHHGQKPIRGSIVYLRHKSSTDSNNPDKRQDNNNLQGGDNNNNNNNNDNNDNDDDDLPILMTKHKARAKSDELIYNRSAGEDKDRYKDTERQKSNFNENNLYGNLTYHNSLDLPSSCLMRNLDSFNDMNHMKDQVEAGDNGGEEEEINEIQKKLRNYKLNDAGEENAVESDDEEDDDEKDEDSDYDYDIIEPYDMYHDPLSLNEKIGMNNKKVRNLKNSISDDGGNTRRVGSNSSNNTNGSDRKKSFILIDDSECICSDIPGDNQSHYTWNSNNNTGDHHEHHEHHEPHEDHHNHHHHDHEHHHHHHHHHHGHEDAHESNGESGNTENARNGSNSGKNHHRRLTCAMVFTKPKVLEIN
ncbi:hypothetical protein B5S33_g800 [[Candida] boidinii]|nr:hypothetical protein B5S33_g800 [[Candida] boidinii]